MKRIHVIPSFEDDGWEVTASSVKNVLKRFKTKREALQFVRVYSRDKKAVLYVHKEDGRVHRRHSYADRDPYYDGVLT